MPSGFQVGAVLHWDRFDKNRPVGAEIKPKFLIVLGAKQGHNFLMLLATATQHRKLQDPGCQHLHGYYYIPGVAKQFFPENTWILLNEPKETSAAELVKLGLSGQVKVVGAIEDNIVRAIINCLKKTPDVSAFHLSLL